MYNKLIKEAIDAREKAYCPYSNFKVGAAVLFEDNNIYSGCNIENASFGATNEFAESQDIKIFIVKNENDYIETTLEKILPGSFTKKDLVK